MPSPVPNILGVILAGGRSRRFGDGDKGFADLNGLPVLAHVIDRFRPQVPRLILNANGDVDRFKGFGLDIVTDSEHPEQGPLSGILAALDWARRQPEVYTKVATVSTDVPFLPPDLVARLEAESGAKNGAKNGNRVAIAMSAGRRHPTIALWPLAVRDAIADALARQALGVNALAFALNAVAVAFPMRDIEYQAIDPFFNVNTPDDLATARALIAKS
jgi:molybdopterin-guanine dinucleotide biosynthesis protein A